MKQEEKRPHVSDYVLKLFEMYESGKVTGIKIQVDAALNNEEVTALQKENEQLKAKLETAKEALRFYGDGNLTISMESENGPYYIEECQVTSGDFSLGSRARAALKEIEE